MKIGYKASLALSIIIHMALTFVIIQNPQIFMLGGGSGNGKGSGLPGEDEFQEFINPQVITVKVKSVPVNEEYGDKIRQEVVDIQDSEIMVSSQSCDNNPSFGGIGIQFRSDIAGSYIIDKVPEFYPAYRAGMRPGDVIVSDVNSIKGPVGTSVKVSFVRNGQVRTVNIIREKICYSKKNG